MIHTTKCDRCSASIDFITIHASDMDEYQSDSNFAAKYDAEARELIRTKGMYLNEFSSDVELVCPTCYEEAPYDQKTH